MNDEQIDELAALEAIFEKDFTSMAVAVAVAVVVLILDTDTDTRLP
jgi:carbamate kinase